MEYVLLLRCCCAAARLLLGCAADVKLKTI